MHSSRPQHVIRKEFQAYNWNVTPFENEDKWEFIDMWHITSSHVASSSRIGKIDIRRKSYLKQAYNRILQVKETDNSHCFSVVDNLLWLKEDDFDNEPSRLLDYFKELTDIIDEIGGVHFLVLPKGILSDTAEKIIMSIMNGIFDFSRTVVGNRNQDQLSIMKMMGITYQSDIMDITPDSQLGLRIESTGKI
jgi:archaellum biogenesis ATPase FlaH